MVLVKGKRSGLMQVHTTISATERLLAQSHRYAVLSPSGAGLLRLQCGTLHASPRNRESDVYVN